MENFEIHMKEAFTGKAGSQDGGKYWKYTAHPTGPNGKLQMGWGWTLTPAYQLWTPVRKKHQRRGRLDEHAS